MVASPLYRFAKHSRILTLHVYNCTTPTRNMAGNAKKALEALVKLTKWAGTLEVSTEVVEMKKPEHRAKRAAQAEQAAKDLASDRPVSPSGKPTDTFTGSPEDLFESDSVLDTIFNSGIIGIFICLCLLVYYAAFIVAARRLAKTAKHNQEEAKQIYRDALGKGASNFLLIGGGISTGIGLSVLKTWVQEADQSTLLSNPVYASWLTYVVDSDWFFIIAGIFLFPFIFLLCSLLENKGTKTN